MDRAKHQAELPQDVSVQMGNGQVKVILDGHCVKCGTGSYFYTVHELPRQGALEDFLRQLVEKSPWSVDLGMLYRDGWTIGSVLFQGQERRLLMCPACTGKILDADMHRAERLKRRDKLFRLG